MPRSAPAPRTSVCGADQSGSRDSFLSFAEKGHVSRGYIGVSLRDVDPDLPRSLGLTTNDGALVQDVTPGIAGARAGIRAYDLSWRWTARPVSGNDQLIEMIAVRQPGTVASLQILRESHPINIPVKLAERPPRDQRTADRARRSGAAAVERPRIRAGSVSQRSGSRLLPIGSSSPTACRVS
jgi:hypothetical protein